MFRFLLLLIFVSATPVVAQAEQSFAGIGDLLLESGEILHDVRLGYITGGTLNDDKSNVLVLPTWFTGTAANLVDFGHIGPGKLADTDKYYVIAIDALGNSISTSPSNSSLQPDADFPVITTGDMVEAQYRLLTECLGLERVHAVIGISMGGMQAFDWVGRYPDFMQRAILMDSSPRMTSYDLLQWQVHRDIVTLMRDGGYPDIAIFELIGRVTELTLRTPMWFVQNVGPEELESHLAARGTTFNSYDYVVQLDAIMGHNVYGDSDESRRAWLDRISAEVLVIGSSRDHMVNQTPARQAAAALDAEVFINDSFCGHLESTCETDSIAAHARAFLR